MNSHESAVLHFQSLGAHLSRREVDSTPVWGIQLRNRRVSDDDLVHLQQLRGELHVIGLEGTQITDDGLLHLLDLPRLDNVDLTSTAIGDVGCQILSRIKTLRYIHLEGTNVTTNGVAMLQEALPDSEIVWDEG